MSSYANPIYFPNLQNVQIRELRETLEKSKSVKVLGVRTRVKDVYKTVRKEGSKDREEHKKIRNAFFLLSCPEYTNKLLERGSIIITRGKNKSTLKCVCAKLPSCRDSDKYRPDVLLVTGLRQWKADDLTKELIEHFKVFSQVVNVHILKRNGRVTGKAFVSFRNSFDASVVQHFCSNAPMNGRVIRCNYAVTSFVEKETKNDEDSK
jgi:hypothetical protein